MLRGPFSAKIYRHAGYRQLVTCKWNKCLPAQVNPAKCFSRKQADWKVPALLESLVNSWRVLSVHVGHQLTQRAWAPFSLRLDRSANQPGDNVSINTANIPNRKLAEVKWKEILRRCAAGQTNGFHTDWHFKGTELLGHSWLEQAGSIYWDAY